MLKLIKLEYRKNNIKKYILSSIIMLLCLIAMILPMIYTEMTVQLSEGLKEVEYKSNEIIMAVGILSDMCYMVFTGVMISSFIVGTFNNKTMNLMFSYPISRRKILLSQILSIWIFSFIALIITKLVLYTTAITLSPIINIKIPFGFNMMDMQFFIRLVLQSVYTVTTAFICLYIGLWRKSTKVTIISSLLLFSLLQGQFGDGITLAKFVIVPIIVTIVAVFLIIASLNKIEKMDLQ